MRRDMDLIRKLALKIEEVTINPNAICSCRPSELGLDGYSDAEIQYHFNLMVEGGLIDTGGLTMLKGLQFRRLTVAGHDFVDSIRDDGIWERTKNGALAAGGGWTLEVITDLAKAFLRKKISDATGLDL